MTEVIKSPWPMQPLVFLTGAGEGISFDPQGKFHGWLMKRHPDGMWTSVRKLEVVDPFESLPDILKAR